MATGIPVHEELFPEGPDALPAVFRLQFGARLGRDDAVAADGTMNVRMSPLARPFSFAFRLLGTLAPEAGTGMPARVVFRTRAGDSGFWYDRAFELPGGRTARFASRVEPAGAGEAVEWTRVGIGWRSAYAVRGGRVRLDHRGYRLRLGRLDLPLPAEWLLGRPAAWQEPLGDRAFRMEMAIRHPLLGALYSCDGRFEIAEAALG